MILFADAMSKRARDEEELFRIVASDLKVLRKCASMKSSRANIGSFAPASSCSALVSEIDVVRSTTCFVSIFFSYLRRVCPEEFASVTCASVRMNSVSPSLAKLSELYVKLISFKISEN